MRVLITGGSGMLGSYAATQAAERGWETWATYHSHEVSLPGCTMLRLDLVNLRRVSKAVRNIRPDVIIHTAANAKPDLCEMDSRQARHSNMVSTFSLARAADQVGAQIVYVSTDLVFQGGPRPFKEDDLKHPRNVYGETKLEGEWVVEKATVPWAIVRTSVIYGPRMFPHLNSFSDRVIESLRAGTRIAAFTDQRRCPISAWNLADVLMEISERGLTGVYHAVCPESSSRYEFAVKLAEVFGLDKTLVVPITMDEVPAVAHRPNNLMLDTHSTQAALNTRLLGFEEGILELLNRQDAKHAKEG